MSRFIPKGICVEITLYGTCEAPGYDFDGSSQNQAVTRMGVSDKPLTKKRQRQIANKIAKLLNIKKKDVYHAI